jgi:hypothetical protein
VVGGGGELFFVNENPVVASTFFSIRESMILSKVCFISLQPESGIHFGFFVPRYVGFAVTTPLL